MPETHNNADAPQLMTVKQVAARYGKSVASIWSWANQNYNGFPSPVKLTAKTTRWYLDDLLSWENALRNAA